MRPAIRLISVVLPDPENPTMATNSLCSTVSETFLSTCVRALPAANDLLTDLSSRMAIYLLRQDVVRCVKSACNASITRSSRKPMIPIVSTATMILASDAEDPFWNSSQTNFPSPGFCASISAAIRTIHPTPNERRSPVKISGRADGSTSLMIVFGQLRRSTRPTLRKSLSIDPTPWAVLIRVGHSEHKVTVIAETRNDFGRVGLSDM